MLQETLNLLVGVRGKFEVGIMWQESMPWTVADLVNTLEDGIIVSFVFKY
jgi:hypothetical protein